MKQLDEYMPYEGSYVKFCFTYNSLLCVMSARSDGRAWNSEAAGSNPATQTIYKEMIMGYIENAK